MTQKWKVRKQKTALGIYTETMSGAIGQGWDWLEADYKGEYSTAKRDAICKQLWNNPWLISRAAVNFHGPEKGRTHCMTREFEPIYQIAYSEQGDLRSGDDQVAIVATRRSGNRIFKDYSGSGISMYNVNLELTCKPVDKVWRTVGVTVRVDKPVAYTHAENFSFNIAPSILKVGGSVMVSNGESSSINYGKPLVVPGLSGVYCGSASD